MHIASVGRALPPNYYDQETLIAALESLWESRPHGVRRLQRIHRNALVGGRHLTLPLEAYAELTSFTAANQAFVEHATDLGAQALLDGLDRARLVPRDIDHLLFVSVTGDCDPVDRRQAGEPVGPAAGRETRSSPTTPRGAPRRRRRAP
jgi:alkylresorcinol/alkylpyrone synthase